jgi:hypothetical protein
MQDETLAPQIAGSGARQPRGVLVTLKCAPAGTQITVTP